jgi:2,4-dienoyl-CoA reductase-like NADH-dependent reductase (Old Yellow Enzyme family)
MDKKLFQPIRIRGTELKNRIAFAPLLMVGDGDGSYVGDKMIRWHEARARGETGLIMMGAVIVSSAFKRGVVPGRVEVSLPDAFRLTLAMNMRQTAASSIIHKRVTFGLTVYYPLE